MYTEALLFFSLRAQCVVIPQNTASGTRTRTHKWEILIRGLGRKQMQVVMYGMTKPDP